jgi:hypothetical protein
MIGKRKRGLIWWTWTAILNVIFIAYLLIYTGGGGEMQFIGILPEAFVVLIGIVGLAFVSHSVFAWWYLGKPSLSEIYTPEKPTIDEDAESVGSEPTEAVK